MEFRSGELGCHPSVYNEERDPQFDGSNGHRDDVGPSAVEVHPDRDVIEARKRVEDARAIPVPERVKRVVVISTHDVGLPISDRSEE